MSEKVIGSASVRVVADRRELRRGLEEAKRQTSEYTAQSRRSMGQAKAATEQHGRAIRQAADHTAALRGRTREMGSQAERSFRQGAHGANRMGMAVNRLQGMFVRLLAMVGVTGGLAGIFGAGIREASENERAFLRIESQLRATGNAAGHSANEIREFARELGRVTLTNQRDAMSGAAALLAFPAITRANLSRTLELAQDMSAVFGGDLLSNVRMLGLAMEDPVEGATRLRRVGIQLTQQQRDQALAFMQTGNAAQAQEVVLRALEARIGGAGRAEGAGLAGAADAAKENWNAFLEVLTQTTGVASNAESSLGSLARDLGNMASLLRAIRGEAAETQAQLSDVPFGRERLRAGVWGAAMIQRSLPQQHGPVGFPESDRQINQTRDAMAEVAQQTELARERGEALAAALTQLANPAEQLAAVNRELSQTMEFLNARRAAGADSGVIDGLIAQAEEIARRRREAINMAASAASEAQAQLRDRIALENDLALAQARGDEAAITAATEAISLADRIARYRQAGIADSEAQARADEGVLSMLRQLERTQERVAEARRAIVALKADEVAHEIELARLRGDETALRQLEEQERIRRRVTELVERQVEATKALLQAERESAQRLSAEETGVRLAKIEEMESSMRGLFAKSFADGVMSAMQGDAGEFIARTLEAGAMRMLEQAGNAIFDSLFSGLFDAMRDTAAATAEGAAHGAASGAAQGTAIKTAGVSAAQGMYSAITAAGQAAAAAMAAAVQSGGMGGSKASLFGAIVKGIGFGGGKAGGGRVSPGFAYAINENRQEFFMPDIPGTVIPDSGALAAAAGGGGARGNITFDMRGAVVTADLLEQMQAIAAQGDAQVMRGAVGFARNQMEAGSKAQRRRPITANHG